MNNEFSNIFKRMIAMMIDFTIIGLVAFLELKFCTSFMSYFEIYGIDYIIGIIYFSYFESSKKQATIGKMLIGIIVTDLDGNRITIIKAVTRTIIKYLGVIIYLFINIPLLGYMHIIECLPAFFTPKKQALHDIFAGTVVINKKISDKNN